MNFRHFNCWFSVDQANQGIELTFKISAIMLSILWNFEPHTCRVLVKSRKVVGANRVAANDGALYRWQKEAVVDDIVHHQLPVQMRVQHHL